MRLNPEKTLREFIIKGFVLDDERLKQGKTIFGKEYFDELLDRIREIAQLRVQFENDQEKQKIALLEKDKKLAEERLNSQTPLWPYLNTSKKTLVDFITAIQMLLHPRYRPSALRNLGNH